MMPNKKSPLTGSGSFRESPGSPNGGPGGSPNDDIVAIEKEKKRKRKIDNYHAKSEEEKTLRRNKAAIITRQDRIIKKTNKLNGKTNEFNDHKYNRVIPYLASIGQRVTPEQKTIAIIESNKLVSIATRLEELERDIASDQNEIRQLRSDIERLKTIINSKKNPK